MLMKKNAEKMKRVEERAATMMSGLDAKPGHSEPAQSPPTTEDYAGKRFPVAHSSSVEQTKG